MLSRASAVASLLVLLVVAPAGAAPRHDFCGDVGGSFAFGVSSYGGVRDWLGESRRDCGADFRFAYVYILAEGMEDPERFETWYVRPFLDDAKAAGAVPVCTFYQLLGIGTLAGVEGGSEAAIVAQVLQDSALMRRYFDSFVWLLRIAAEYDPPIVVHVEPDSWGFMMWAMGVEGNDDPTSIPVQVAGSGHPDLSGFPDNAAGLGQALLALRDRYAPEVRLGWHASNFRVGNFPEVVTRFYSQMGEWDLLVGDGPHVDPDPSAWWEPWEEDAVATNLRWMSEVTAAAGIPLVLWQIPIGSTDYHLLGDPDDRALLARFAEAGAVAVLFEHINHNGVDDPDGYRASGDFGAIPPAEQAEAGGTAGTMRRRVMEYTVSPLRWPEGSLCAGTPEADAAGLGTGDAAVCSAGDGAGERSGGCGCVAASGSRGAAGLEGGWSGAALTLWALGRLRPRGSRSSRPRPGK